MRRLVTVLLSVMPLAELDSTDALFLYGIGTFALGLFAITLGLLLT